MAVAVTRTLEEGEATAEGLLSKSLKPRRCRCEGYFLLTVTTVTWLGQCLLPWRNHL
jgi:hypothetical protein